ncbi:hypothetical protein LPA44_17145 [Halobacterium sp. KA-4]|uniref:hypothetical protein n=1 Tax=Halobacterium sp. KA-4 TaxID=2896367 RepID=UPI001E2EA557|nr:hypothetical protein [Halobacterium sp. KA-4]MCD2201591.1 hypothetical protein [Halobacterium sp. KA-4]
MTSSVYLYHLAPRRALEAITQEGIQPSDSTHRDSLEAGLAEIAAEKDISLPINRQQCSFLYPSLELAVENLHPADGRPLSTPEVVVVIDAMKIDRPLYMGEFQLISDAIDFQYLEEPDDVMISESYEDALTRYATSLTEIPSANRIASLSDQYRRPEIIVEGSISPTGIIEYLSLKSVAEHG